MVNKYELVDSAEGIDICIIFSVNVISELIDKFKGIFVHDNVSAFNLGIITRKLIE